VLGNKVFDGVLQVLSECVKRAPDQVYGLLGIAFVVNGTPEVYERVQSDFGREENAFVHYNDQNRGIRPPQYEFPDFTGVSRLSPGVERRYCPEKSGLARDRGLRKIDIAYLRLIVVDAVLDPAVFDVGPSSTLT
jgi:hypothetical protein